MQNEPDEIQIKVTPEFKRSLRTLAKKYRNIRSDKDRVGFRCLNPTYKIGDRTHKNLSFQLA